GALQRVVRGAGARRAAGAAELCELCRAPVAAGHRHLYDTARRELLCACVPCSLLFEQGAASNGHFRQVPGRRVRLAPLSTEPLGVPVGLAFFVPHDEGGVVANFPGPAGPAQSDIDAAAWQQVTDEHPELADLEIGVQALLVNTVRDQQHHWIVPLDDCYRLVALVRQEWRGLSGGGRVWPEVERFFAELTERS
ncbi:hypothetical protein N566_13375, partial [Streptomycetaceae bacterium MP113-05]